jgi:hypothetical protein
MIINKKYKKLEITLPPYNGWGNEEDSRGNCLRLIPKQPKKDFYKFVDKDSVILRFLGKLNSKTPEDLDRKFLISYFLSDDTVKIYEMPKKNSGKKIKIYIKIYIKIFLFCYF